MLNTDATQLQTQPIHPDARLGAVHLTVSDLDRSLKFYLPVLGFQVHERQNGVARLGAGLPPVADPRWPGAIAPGTGGGDDLLVLTEQPGAQRFIRGHSGLYHFAVLVPSRLELARSLRRMSEAQTPLDGFSDHLVSEAIYLPDPDGNGIEVYRDRPRSEWYDARGQFRMGSEPLDIRGILAELTARPEPADNLDPATVIGHIHLHVAHLAQAEQFYHGALGFDLMMRYGPTASFVSAGGYHHHIGFNTWAGVGAPPPPPDAVGLRHFEVRLPNDDALSRTVDRARAAGLGIEERAEGLLVRDPSQNAVMLTAK
jgi:catechol 2,3-dioxygenase